MAWQKINAVGVMHKKYSTRRVVLHDPFLRQNAQVVEFVVANVSAAGLAKYTKDKPVTTNLDQSVKRLGHNGLPTASGSVYTQPQKLGLGSAMWQTN